MLDYMHYNINGYNIVSFLIGTVVFYILYLKLGFSKERACIYSLLTAPAIYFNTFFLADAVTADEQRYIPMFNDISALKPGTANYIKASYQYRVTQTVLGSVFQLVRAINPDITLMTANILYKMAHWFFFTLIAAAIGYMWGKYVLVKADSPSWRMSVLGTVYFLIGLPVGCLILKVANYDAGNIYFAVLGFSFTLAFSRTKSIKFAWLAVFAGVCGCLEKWTSFIYLGMILGLLTYDLAKAGIPIVRINRCQLLDRACQKMRTFRQVETGLLAAGWAGLFFFCSCLICLAQYAYVRLLIGKGMIDMGAGAVLFPLTYMTRVLMGNGQFNVSNINYYNSGVIKYILISFLLILFAGSLFCVFEKLDKKICLGEKTLVQTLTVLLGGAIVLSGVLGAYILPCWVYPFTDFPEGVYQPACSFNNVAYFYGAASYAGHTICNMIFANAVVVANIPTPFLLLFCFALLTVFKSPYSEENHLLQVLFFVSLCLIGFLTLAGQPADARYFGVPIVMAGLCTVAIIYEWLKRNQGTEGFFQQRLAILSILLVTVYCAELGANLPMYHCFRPLWLIRENQFYDNIRQGKIYAAEAMTWGEDLALAGKWLEKYCQEKDINVKDITVVCDYVINWYTNPGFKLMPYSTWEKEGAKFDEKKFFVFVKFKRYRSKVPYFMTSVKALHIVRVNGEATAWMYNGTQLKEAMGDNEKLF